ncbi:helix-turn-helix domain-containing protein [Skermania sp. ID1734]|uniref:helix-turn-helix domain-containing protein n=1 Tax=Skermania sp. ID1734 TaxID=2597516 RepID=UPI0021042BEF|nr:helix-turn-helix transcriptional regulator [Skermania sp. ID1734]
MTTSQRQPVGVLLRHWREQRRLSQLELATRSAVSARHLSFLETGRARPTRSMLLKLSDHLDIPLREQNQLLLAGGYAPAYPEHTLADVPMAAVSDAIRQVLDGHLPAPALVVDRHWDLVESNAAVSLFLDGCAPRLLEPPVNVLRLSLHPDGLAPRIRNLSQWRAHILHRLSRQCAATADEGLYRLHDELARYPSAKSAEPAEDTAGLVVPVRLASPAGEELAFISTTTVFGTPLDVTVAELAIEAFYPADKATADFLARQ